MQLDLNAYYCASNLPRLYRTRARAGDEERAQTPLRLTIAACERARRLNLVGKWLRPTLLAAASELGDPLADHAAFEFSEDAAHLKHRPAQRCTRVERLLVQTER
jgi:hypothetical protein